MTAHVPWCRVGLCVPRGPGSYRYYNGTALFTFGQGLSYTQFELSCTAAAQLSFSCSVKNTGSVAGDEVVQVFHSVSSAIRTAAKHPVPIRRLVDFGRVSLAAGASATLQFTLPKERLALVTASGASMLYAGEHTLTFTRGHGDVVTQRVTIGHADAFTRTR